MIRESEEKPNELPPMTAQTPVLFVLLGASNLARACFALKRHLEACLHPRPVEVMVATGPGRGYCVPGGLLTAVYPPIVSSPIFEAAREKAESGTRVVALVTDIGNDIMYGVPAEDLIATLRQVFDRLQSIDAEIFYTTLPEKLEGDISPVWYYFLRTLLVPGSRVPYDRAIDAIARLNRFLRSLDLKNGHRIPGLDRYFGTDEIHFGWLSAQRAWTAIARRMFEVLDLHNSREIELTMMVRSYWADLEKLVGSDLTGFVKKPPNHY